jgi:predicted transcriptional regulator
MTQNEKSVKRDKFAIMLNILNLARAPIKRTQILYRANINFYQLTRYLDLLIKVGMIEEKDSPTRNYRTTEKGLEFIKMFEPKAEVIEYEQQTASKLLQLK